MPGKTAGRLSAFHEAPIPHGGGHSGFGSVLSLLHWEIFFCEKL